jgi:hypothetical protein
MVMLELAQKEYAKLFSEAIFTGFVWTQPPVLDKRIIEE